MQPILDAVGVECVETDKEGFFMALSNIIQTNRAVRLLSTVLAAGKQLVYLTLQASAFLLLLLCLVEDEDVSIGPELVLHGSFSVLLEHGC